MLTGLSRWALVGALLSGTSAGAQERAASWVDIAPLRAIEKQVLPPVIVPGPATYADLPAYYWGRNPELKKRLDEVKRAYERSVTDPKFEFRAVTLIAGSAGVGKTFIKSEAISPTYPPEATVKLDLKELYQQWAQEGKVHERPDLTANGTVLSTLPSLDNREMLPLKDHLQAKPSAAFYIIDSLDEVHPNDYTSLLQQVERFALDSKQRFVHAVVLGRTFAFAEHWTALRHDTRSPEQLKLFYLKSPQLRTTGDVAVSSLNYDTFFHKLRWSPAGTAVKLDQAAYDRFQAAGFALRGEFETVTATPNKSMTAECRKAFLGWTQQKPFVVAGLGNLAGNGIWREVCETCYARPESDGALQEAYLAAWLRRESKAASRPSAAAPEKLASYLQLIEETAVKYLREGKIDRQGWFSVSEVDQVTFRTEGHDLRVRVSRILDRSGMKELELTGTGERRYRFEPFWLHGYFVDRYNQRVQQASSR